MNITGLSEQEQLRRQSLEELRKLGINPYPAEEYKTNVTSKEIKEKLKVVKKPEERIKLVKQLHISKKVEKNLEKGLKRHEELGKQITKAETQKTQINYLKYIGYGILVLVIIAIIFSLIKWL